MDRCYNVIAGTIAGGAKRSNTAQYLHFLDRGKCTTRLFYVEAAVLGLDYSTLELYGFDDADYLGC